jgi:peptide/nickel transport system substrate-binding protein
MQLSRLNPRIIILSFFFVIFFGLCSKAEGRSQEPRGEIRIVESWRPDVTVLGHNVLQSLFEYGLDRNELAPSLAVSYEWVDDTTLEVKLRPGVAFHNGEPFDAYAVKFNFEYQHKHNPGRGVQVYMRNLERIDVVDTFTIQMILKEPDSLFLSRNIVAPIAGWIIGAPRYMAKMGWEEFLAQPIGTGPYMVEGRIGDYRNVAEGEPYATLVANPIYWSEGHPKIKKIVFVQYSQEAALTALTTGSVDLVTSLIPKDTLKVAEGQHSKVVKGREDVIFTVGALNLNSTQTLPLRDMRVRKALNYAVNKEELIRYVFKGNAVAMKGVLMDKSGVDLFNTESYQWNIPKARELLKEAGYENGFKMKIYCQERDYLVARLLGRFYGLLNIEVEITPMTFEGIVKHMVYPNTREGYAWEDEDWWIAITSNPSYFPEPMVLHVEAFFRFGAPWQHFPDWLIVPLDRMYREVLRTKDVQKRFQIYKRANEYIADQAFWVFTVAPLSLYGVNKEVNFVPQVSQYLYLEFSSVTENHWSLSGKNN